MILMLLIHRRDARVALDHAFAGGHLRTLAIRAIALAHRALRAVSILGMRREPLAHLFRILRKARDPFRFLERERRLDGQRIGRAMPFDHGARHGFEFGRLLLDVGPRATPSLRRVARELDAIDGEHLVTDEPVIVADRDDRAEHVGDILAERAHEVSNRRAVRRGIAAQGDERDVLATRRLDLPTADHATGVRDEHHREQHGWPIRRGARDIIAKPGVKPGEIEFVLEQVVHSVLEGAGQQLSGQIDRDKPRTRIDVLVAGHGEGTGERGSTGLHAVYKCDTSIDPTIASCVSFPHHVRRVFLQPR